MTHGVPVVPAVGLGLGDGTLIGLVLGLFLGCLLMAVIVNSLTPLGVDVYWNTLVIGATLLLAVTVDTLAKKLREK
jgi:ABC-type xylose transport system permease subunit